MFVVFVFVVFGSQLSADFLKRGGSVDDPAPFKSPSRLSAFHFFCKHNLLPLYEELYNNDDFKVVTAPLVDDTADAGVSQKAGDVPWVSLEVYGQERLPIDVFSMLSAHPLERLFDFYARRSLKGRADVGEEEKWVSVGFFLRMLRDLGVLPGFLSAEAALCIARISGEKANAEATPPSAADSEESCVSPSPPTNQVRGVGVLVLTRPETPAASEERRLDSLFCAFCRGACCFPPS